jgi:hypothetical protein
MYIEIQLQQDVTKQFINTAFKKNERIHLQQWKRAGNILNTVVTIGDDRFPIGTVSKNKDVTDFYELYKNDKIKNTSLAEYNGKFFIVVDIKPPKRSFMETIKNAYYERFDSTAKTQKAIIGRMILNDIKTDTQTNNKQGETNAK